MKLRFQLSTVLLGVTIVCVIAGWITDRQFHQRRHARELKAAEAQAQFEANLNYCVGQVATLSYVDTDSPLRLESRRKNCLILAVFSLAPYEASATPKQQRAAMQLACMALEYLENCDTIQDFEKLVATSDLLEELKAPVLDKNHQDYAVVHDYLQRVFENYRSQPDFVGRQWLQAIQKNQIDQLPDISAKVDSPESLQSQWEVILTANADAVSVIRRHPSREFCFEWTASDVDGSVTISRHDVEIITLPIVAVDGSWKIDLSSNTLQRSSDASPSSIVDQLNPNGKIWEQFTRVPAGRFLNRAGGL